MEDSTRAEQTALSYRHRHCTICHPRRHRHPGTHCPCGAPEGGEGERAARGFVFPLALRPLLKGAALGHARGAAGGVVLGGK